MGVPELPWPAFKPLLNASFTVNGAATAATVAAEQIRDVRVWDAVDVLNFVSDNL
jgi:hypothetical protein